MKEGSPTFFPGQALAKEGRDKGSKGLIVTFLLGGATIC